LRVLLTASGCPGSATLIRNLRLWDRDLYILGVDADPTAIGSVLCDDFEVVPRGDDPDYPGAIVDLFESRDIDVVFPQSSSEVLPLSRLAARGEITAAVGRPFAVATALSKVATYTALDSRVSRAVPRWFLATCPSDLFEAAEILGYPHRPVVVKPPEGKGSRGVRILKLMDRAECFRLLMSKPTHLFCSLEEYAGAVDFDRGPVMVMEYLEGREMTVDCLCFEGRPLISTVKSVDRSLCGVITRGELIREPGLVDLTAEILRAIPLSFCVNLQFIGHKLVEINPRVSTIIDQPEFYTPYLALQLATGRLSPDEIASAGFRPEYGRRMIRFFDMVSLR